MLSIDNADVEGMKDSAEKLDAGKYYGLMACMITGRSWPAIVKGIYRTPKTASEASPAYWSTSCVLSDVIPINIFKQVRPTCGQSYKASTIVIYHSRVVPDLKIPHITTLES